MQPTEQTISEFLNLLTQDLWGNPLYQWGVAIIVSLGAMIALRLLRRILKQRLQNIRIAPALITDTRRFFLRLLSLYLGSLFIQLSPKLEVTFSKILVVGFLIQAGFWGTTAISYYIENSLKKRAATDAGLATTLGLVSFLSKLILFSMVGLLSLHNLGVDITALVAGLGVSGIAIALAVQNILGDLFASLTIVLDKPFIVGDIIAVGEFTGTIEQIGLKTTRLKSATGEQLIFSNNDLLQSRIRNFQRLTERRISLPIGVTYDTPSPILKQIPALIQSIIESHQKVRFERAHLIKMGDFSLNFEAVFWVTDKDFQTSLDIQQSIFLQLIEKFEKEKIEFAYPTSVQYQKELKI